MKKSYLSLVGLIVGFSSVEAFAGPWTPVGCAWDSRPFYTVEHFFKFTADASGKTIWASAGIQLLPDYGKQTLAKLAQVSESELDRFAISYDAKECTQDATNPVLVSCRFNHHVAYTKGNDVKVTLKNAQEILVGKAMADFEIYRKSNHPGYMDFGLLRRFVIDTGNYTWVNLSDESFWPIANCK